MNLIHKGLNVLFFDIETTGFPTRYNPIDIIEVGMVLVPNLGSPESKNEVLSQLYSSPKGVPPNITKITGIDSSMLKGKPHISEHIDAIQNRVDRADILVAHNAPFDIRCLEAVGVNFIGKEVFDTATHAKRILPQLPNHTMSDVTAHLNIVNEDAHRAIYDVKAMVEAYLILTDKDKYGDEIKALTKKHKKLTYTKVLKKKK